MTASLEDRIDLLERRMLSNTARLNAHEKLVLSVFSEVIMNMPDPIWYVEQAKQLWTSSPSTPARQFPGVDPAYLDLVSAEYDKSIADILSLLDQHIRNLVAAKLGRP